MSPKKSSLHARFDIVVPPSLRLSFAVVIASLVALLSASSVEAAGQRCSAPASDAIVKALASQAPRLKADVLRMALDASHCAAQEGLVKRRELLTVIDYSLPSTEPRMWVFDVKLHKLLFEEHVAHGVNSGDNLTTRFSNINGSRQTSLGLYVTQETYIGQNGYSLRLQGLDRGFNDLARARAIVMHGAPYVNPEAARSQGRLGRSWGCPAVRTEVARTMIDTVKDGTPIFAYYPDDRWLSSSKYLVR
ncbi:MAG: murein L,D-transpeptidase catalytic domain family protein [Acidobacteria bacterium]|nr:murein L,D-transpeptidase catalytic domain family protein [Acidobacteriota bacterium]